MVAVLNGDVDNHADIKVHHGLRIAGPITTDAKVIPAVMARHVAGGVADLGEAFRRTVAEFEGSVAIAAAAADRPDQLFLALRGSGQALYVGMNDDHFIVASEPYGVVEETTRFVRMDGESLSPSGSRGQVFVLDGTKAGQLDGLRRLAYDGGELPLTESDIATAQVTTRDIDRGDSPHYLLKEISEAPASFRKTIRGKIVEVDGLLRATVGARALPPDIRARLADGSITKIKVIGQGTAAVAGRSMAAMLDALADGQLDVDPITATELSGFGMRLDMSDTLVVAVSQSGTTTDTNRTVDLVRGRGAAVLGIVNRRNSDLTDKADGVMYTSDGRDVEMSVASTKAFYAQVAAGVLLACAITEAANVGSAQRRHVLLTSLRQLPDALVEVLSRREVIADAARRFAPSKRYWAIVGSGPNTVAAEEVRIKLSELCYKSIACDVTEDKKHIDLSSEPLILVCAAGLVGGTADDVAKEVAIYKAHKATPIVVATEGDERFAAAAAVLSVPAVDSALAFVLTAMVGHLFGYEAALAIDASARPLREAQRGDRACAGRVRQRRRGAAQRAPRHRPARRSIRRGPALRAVRRSSRGVHRRAAVGSARRPARRASPRGVPPRNRQGGDTRRDDRRSHGFADPCHRRAHPAGRRHQASGQDGHRGYQPQRRRSARSGAGAGRAGGRCRPRCAELSHAEGARRPRSGCAVGDRVHPLSHRRRSGGRRPDLHRRSRWALLEVPSRVERNPQLVGTKRRVAAERQVLVARGRSDGRTVILVPEVKSGVCIGITLLHVVFHDRLPAAVMRGVLQGYDHRYDRLVDWVSETEGVFRDDLLGEFSVADLLIAPISEAADQWRS